MSKSICRIRSLDLEEKIKVFFSFLYFIFTILGIFFESVKHAQKCILNISTIPW